MTTNMPMRAGTDPVAPWNRFPARVLSLLLALGLSGLVIAWPRLFAPLGDVHHGGLALMMLGVSAGFVHGVGFIPRAWPLKVLFGPWTGWTLMLGGFFWATTHP